MGYFELVVASSIIMGLMLGFIWWRFSDELFNIAIFKDFARGFLYGFGLVWISFGVILLFGWALTL